MSTSVISKVLWIREQLVGRNTGIQCPQVWLIVRPWANSYFLLALVFAWIQWGHFAVTELRERVPVKFQAQSSSAQRRLGHSPTQAVQSFHFWYPSSSAPGGKGLRLPTLHLALEKFPSLQAKEAFMAFLIVVQCTWLTIYHLILFQRSVTWSYIHVMFPSPPSSLRSLFILQNWNSEPVKC